MEERRTGFESPYNITFNQVIDIKNTGNNYSENLMTNSFSQYMYRNIRLRTFIESHLKPIFINYINAVRKLRIFYNYTVPKDWKHIN